MKSLAIPVCLAACFCITLPASGLRHPACQSKFLLVSEFRIDHSKTWEQVRAWISCSRFSAKISDRVKSPSSLLVLFGWHWVYLLLSLHLRRVAKAAFSEYCTHNIKWFRTYCCFSCFCQIIKIWFLIVFFVLGLEVMRIFSVLSFFFFYRYTISR